MADALISALAELVPQRLFPHILELGCGEGLLSDRIEKYLCFQHLTLVDIAAGFAECHRRRQNAVFLAGDMETMQLPEADLVLAGAVFQWAVNLPGLLARIYRLLPQGGILAFSTFGPGNLREIAALTGRSLSYPALNELISMLEEQQFSVLMSREEQVLLTFPTPVDALRHLQETGVNGMKPGRAWTRQRLDQFFQDYRQVFQRRDGRYPLSYHPIWIIAEKHGQSRNSRDFA